MIFVQKYLDKYFKQEPIYLDHLFLQTKEQVFPRAIGSKKSVQRISYSQDILQNILGDRGKPKVRLNKITKSQNIY